MVSLVSRKTYTMKKNKKSIDENVLKALKSSNNQSEIESILADYYLRQGIEFVAPCFYADKISIKPNMVIFENLNYNYKLSYTL